MHPQPYRQNHYQDSEGLNNVHPRVFTSKCRYTDCHQVNCYYYHDIRQQRRPLEKFNYKPIPCQYVFRGDRWDRPDVCPNRSKCEFAHTANEIKFYSEIDRKSLQSRQIFSEKVLEVSPLERNENVSYVNHLARFLEDRIKLQNQVYQNELDLNEKIKEVEKVEKSITLLYSKALCIGCKDQRYVLMLLPCRHMICKDCWNNGVCIRCAQRVNDYIIIN